MTIFFRKSDEIAVKVFDELLKTDGGFDFAVE